MTDFTKRVIYITQKPNAGHYHKRAIINEHMTDFITRFAPSPTGRLHLGHAFSAACAFNAARDAGGACLLRIEDTDKIRCRSEYEEGIYKDLNWLGFDWPTPVRRQSKHTADYDQALTKLRDLGLVYRCFKTRREVMEQSALAPHDANQLTTNTKPTFKGQSLPRREEKTLLADGMPYAWRLSLTACRDYIGTQWNNLSFIEKDNNTSSQQHLIAATPNLFGDVILARKDTGTSYHLACVHDDALQGVTHIIRGQDLFNVTHLHVLLQYLLELPTPTYHHHALLLDNNGKRFAKRDKAKTIQAMRKGGMSRSEIYNCIHNTPKSTLVI